MIGPLAIATQVLAILSDDEDRLQDVLERAIVTGDASMVEGLYVPMRQRNAVRCWLEAYGKNARNIETLYHVTIVFYALFPKDKFLPKMKDQISFGGNDVAIFQGIHDELSERDLQRISKWVSDPTFDVVNWSDKRPDYEVRSEVLAHDETRYLVLCGTLKSGVGDLEVTVTPLLLQRPPAEETRRLEEEVRELVEAILP